MQRYKTSLVILLIILISLCSFFSCKNASDYINGSEVTIIEPSFDTATGEEKELISAEIKIDSYEIMMVPQLEETFTGTEIYGSTKGKGNGGSDYIRIDADKLQNIGYFAQGLWTFGLKAYSSSYGDLPIFVVSERTVEINGNKRTIQLKATDIDYDSSNKTPCNVYLNELDILLVDSFDKYCTGEEYKVTVSINPISTGGTAIGETIIQFTDDMQHTDKVAKISNIDVTSINKIKPGTYVLSVYFYQKVNGSWVKDGGVSYGFTAIPGATLSIKLKEEIDLYPHKFKSVGTSGSGIIIDSGIKSNVTIEAWKVVEGSNPDFSTGVTVSTNDSVKFRPVITDGPSSISTYKWFVDGVEQPGTNIDSNGYLTYKPTTAKTYTITYMFLDGTSYNIISGNYYLTVTGS